MFGDKGDVKDVKYTELKKKYKLRDKEISISIQNAMTGVVNGEIRLLDEDLIDNMLEDIVKVVKRNSSTYNVIPSEIILRNNSYKNIEQREQNSGENSDEESASKIIESYKPRFTLEQVALNKSVKEKIRTAISAIKYKSKMSDEWGMSEHFSGSRAIILNFYGKAGTGKSMSAEAVASALGQKVYHVNYSELESKYVGETPKNIKKAFEYATKDEAVLIFDEADSFLGKRLTSVTQSADYGVNITRSVLLMELEKFSGVVVFTTNLIDNYDEAFKRRILLSVYFEMPDEAARNEIWKLHLNSKIPLADDVRLSVLSRKYENISGADIKDMVFYAALHTLESEKDKLDLSVFDYAYKVITERYENRDRKNEFKVVSHEVISEEEYRRETGQEEKNG